MRDSARSFVATRAIPQAELERIATAGVELVALSRRLVELSERIAATSPPLAESLQREISMLLDLADAVSNAARASTYLK